MPIRKDFIIHWTGRAIHGHKKPVGKDKRSTIKPSQITEKQRIQYVELCRSILTNGLWLTGASESLISAPGYGSSYAHDMSCFTETPLSQAGEHVRRYGCLGIGFDRKFLIDRGGGPVFYIPDTVPDSPAAELEKAVGALIRKATAESSGPISIPEELVPLVSSQGQLGGMMKRMNYETGVNDFYYLDESEWRILRSQKQIDKGRQEERRDEKLYLPISPQDVRVLVFPDAETKTKCLMDDCIRNWLGEGIIRSFFVTIEDCTHF